MRSSLSTDFLVALVAAVVWAAIDAARLRSTLPAGVAFLALFGSASLLLGVGVVVTRRARPLGDVVLAAIAGAALATLPLTVLSAALQRVTHHRALGGVTFAFVALVILALAFAVAWRLLRTARQAGTAGRVAMTALVVASLASGGAVVVLVLRGAGAPSATPLVPGLVDALTGALLFAAAIVISPRAARFRARAGAALWACAVMLGIATTALTPGLCAPLSAGAPVAFAIGAGLGEHEPAPAGK